MLHENARDSKTALAECVLWWCLTTRFDDITQHVLAQIFGKSVVILKKKSQAPLNIAAFPWFRIRWSQNGKNPARPDLCLWHLSLLSNEQNMRAKNTSDNFRHPNAPGSSGSLPHYNSSSMNPANYTQYPGNREFSSASAREFNRHF